jgi:beta-phosphoglucomutase
MSALDAILFDFDGVLLDSEPVHFACWSEVLAEIGVPFDWPTYQRYCIGVSDKQMLAFLAARRDPPLDVEHLWSLYPVKRERYRARMAAAPPFPPGMAGFLEELANGYRLAVVSSSGRPEVEPLLEVAGLRRYLDAVVCGEDVALHKPDPEPYRLGARLLGAAAPLVVEDSAAGLASGRAAGFEVLHVPDPARTVELVRHRLRRSSGSLPPSRRRSGDPPAGR